MCTGERLNSHLVHSGLLLLPVSSSSHGQILQLETMTPETEQNLIRNVFDHLLGKTKLSKESVTSKTVGHNLLLLISQQ